MGWVLMNEHELQRVEVLSRVVDGSMSAAKAAAVMAVSIRHVRRMLSRFRQDGAASLAHKSRGRPSNHRLAVDIRETALSLVRSHYADFGPTLATEKLAERHGVTVSRETLRTWMAEDGLWLSRKQRRTFHQPRLRRECYGELIQIDGSDHRWFEERGPACTLLVFIDDATSALMQMRFVPSESTFTYFEALDGYLSEHGRPVAFYSDKHTVFRVAKAAAKTGHGMTQFGRALAELNIEILCANSSQAKGRVERANRTLQDRLVKELRLEGISDMAAANAFLPGFMARYNSRFARVPARSDNQHRPLNLPPERKADILCWRDQRYVDRQLTLRYERKRIMLEENEITRDLVGKYVETYVFPDGRIDIRWKGISLAWRAFDHNQQHVTHAAIAENKRLSEVLAYAKALQEAAPPKITSVGKQRSRYQPTGKRSPGAPSFLDKRAARRAAEAALVAGQVSDV